MYYSCIPPKKIALSLERASNLFSAPSHLPEFFAAGIGTVTFPPVAEVSKGRSLHLSG